MELERAENAYKIWASDDMVYGPVDLPTLIQWAQDHRVLPHTWIHLQAANTWRQAKDLEPLRPFLSEGPETAPPRRSGDAGRVVPEEMRQFALFAGLSNQQLEQFIGFGEVCEARPGELIIQKGNPGDALYFILTGEVRARLLTGSEETTLGRIPAGEFFGEMAMFTHTPRSADIVAETETRLLRMNSQAFHRLTQRVPELAATVLYAVARNMARRILEVNRRWQREAGSEWVWH